MVIKPVETIVERIIRVMDIDVCRCPWCKKGLLVPLAVVPRTRSPTFIGLDVHHLIRS
jgi:hypothetical protein